MRRQDIEREALRLFAERGIAAVTTRDIAQAVGCGESGLYRHMASKEELALRVFSEAYAAFAGRLRAAISADPAFAKRVPAIITEIYAAFDENPVLLRFLVLRQHDGIPASSLGENNPVEVVHACVADAVASSEIPNLTADIALPILMGIALQPLTNALYGRLPIPLAPLAPVMANAALRALEVEI